MGDKNHLPPEIDKALSLYRLLLLERIGNPRTDMTPTELKVRREALSLSQNDLAGALGVHKRTVAAWEQGRQRIPEYLTLALETLERRVKKK